MKTIIHEQNVLPGRANKLLAKFVDRVAVSFSKTKEYLDISPDKIVVTGNPLRQELRIIDKAEARRFFGFKDAFTILVMGGSQGSHAINMAFLDCLANIPQAHTLQVIHICGGQDLQFLNDSYRKLKLQVRVFSFLKEIQYAYSVADIVLCRAGATSIAELMRFKLPAIIIPYPYAYQHQRKNAEALEEIGSALIATDDALKDKALLRLLQGLMDEPVKLTAMRSGYQGIGENDAGALLVHEVVSLA
jgi:UDP-N-acetylglucosamine--N-acetylmuramyl-(pentapeptide) pyrophosphoryl-undecaprenol N-acetylglucosamine transferase